MSIIILVEHILKFMMLINRSIILEAWIYMWGYHHHAALPLFRSISIVPLWGFDRSIYLGWPHRTTLLFGHLKSFTMDLSPWFCIALDLVRNALHLIWWFNFTLLSNWLSQFTLFFTWLFRVTLHFIALFVFTLHLVGWSHGALSLFNQWSDQALLVLIRRSQSILDLFGRSEKALL